jgi:hypothetical protein
MRGLCNLGVKLVPSVGTRMFPSSKHARTNSREQKDRLQWHRHASEYLRAFRSDTKDDTIFENQVTQSVSGSWWSMSTSSRTAKRCASLVWMTAE